MKTKTTYVTMLTLCLSLLAFGQQSEGVSLVNTNTTTQRTIEVQENIPSTNHQAAAELINYQAVARDGGGNLITNSAINVDFEITDGSGGTVVFTESQNLNTDMNGVFSAQI